MSKQHTFATPSVEQQTGFDETPEVSRPGSAVIKMTRITSTSPAQITKTLSLDHAGTLTKRVPPQMSRGRAEVITLERIEDLSALLPTLTPAQSLCYGVPTAEGDVFEIFSEKTLPRQRKPNQITRKKDDFIWPAGPGLLMLDHDPGKGRNTPDRDALLSLLNEAVPALAGVTRIWYPSASSCIWKSNQELSGIRGQRLYLAVKDARDIERAGKVIADRLWLAGQGWYEVSKSGALLERSLIDTSVWQTNRLDFAAGAACEPPLEQRRGEPLILQGQAALLDTRELLPDLTTEEVTQLENIHKHARAEVAGEADEARRAYVLETANKIAAGDAERFQKARCIAENALMNLRLMGDFPILLDDGSELNVGDVLDAREKYHGRLTHDPLEPDYDGGRVVGKLFLIGGRPVLHSFAHGSRTFKLIRAPRRVEFVGGRTSDLIDRTLEALRGAPDLFDLGDTVVTIENGRAMQLTDATLAYMVGHELQFWCRKKTPQGIEYEADIDPPPKVIRAMLDMGRARRLRPLDAVITAPTIRPDGTVLNQPGYDAHTRLFFDAQGRNIPVVPMHPSWQETLNALHRLMAPFESFPFASALDRSVLLAALLTAAVRPAIPTAPGIAFDAPVQGSGKTLLARCVGILAGGAEPSIWPHVASARDAEAEIRKRLMTALLKGDGALLWDNVLGTFDSASIAAFLTAPTFTDRVLGQSRDATVPNRAIFLASGNNLVLAGDMPRRFLTCRIDPQTDRPFARRFDLDPASYCLEHRPQMIVDALTIVRAWLVADEGNFLELRAPGATASFEDWDALVRQPVAWLALMNPDTWRDPMESIIAAADADPVAEQLCRLLDALHRAFCDRPFTAGDVWTHIQKDIDGWDDDESLNAVVNDLLRYRKTNSISIGRLLSSLKDRRAGNKTLVQLGKVHNVAQWAVSEA